jgi:hypothetical protein
LQQHKLEHLRCESSPNLHHLYGGLTELDVFYDEHDHLLHDLQHLHVHGKHIRRLSLTLNVDYPIPDWNLDIQTKSLPTVCMPNLKELRLEGMDLKRHYELLSQLIDFATLTHLSIMESDHIDQFISALHENSPTTGIGLKHLATGKYWSSVVGNYPTALLLPAPSMKSLHCSLDHYLHPENLLSLGSQLKSLSLDCCEAFPIEEVPNKKSFADLCDAFSNLEQLGWKLPQGLRFGFNDRTHEVESFMVCT